MHPAQQADFLWYFDRASDLANGKGYYWMGQATAYWPIGWPFFLSLIFRVTGPSVIVGLVLNAVLSTVIVGLIYVVTRQIFGRTFYAMAAAIIYSLLPSQIIWNSVLGSEEIFTALLLLSVVLYIRQRRDAQRFPWWIACSGLILGFACDVRPIPLAFPAFVFLYEWLVMRNRVVQALWRAVVLFVGMFLTILPVTIRNKIALHHWVLVSTNGGTNLFQGIHTNGGYWWSYNPYLNPILHIKNEVQKNAVAQSYAIHYIEHHIPQTIINGFKKIWDLYKADVNSAWYTFRVSPHVASWLKYVDGIATTGYFLFMLPAVIGLMVLFVRRIPGWRTAMFPFAFIVYNTCFFFFFPAWDRFRYPLMPLFAIFAGVGFAVAWKQMRGQVDPAVEAES